MRDDTTSFFHRIQSLFSADYHGRYLALILTEVGSKYPACLIDFFAHVADIPKRKFTSPRFEVEYGFQGAGDRKRRADIAVYANDDDHEPTLLVEIKYYDKPGVEQLPDYVAWTAGGKERYFVALCREQLSIDGVVAVRWGDLVKRLKLHVVKSELVQLLIDYLEKEGITMQYIEPKPLIVFFKSLLCSPWGSNRLTNNIQGPFEFGKLQMNVKYMAGAFDPLFKQAWKAAGEQVEGESYAKKSRTATIGFYHWQYLKTNDNSKLFDGEDMYLLNSQRDGGMIRVFAQYSFGHESDTLRIGFGFEFEVGRSSDSTNEPKTLAYAFVNGTRLSEDDAKERRVSRKIQFADITEGAQDAHGKIERLIGKLLVDVVSKLAAQRAPLLKQQNVALSHLLKMLPKIQ